MASALGEISDTALAEFEQNGLLQMARSLQGEIYDRTTQLKERATNAEAELEAVKVKNRSMAQALRSMGELNVRLEAELESVVAELAKHTANQPGTSFLGPLEKQSMVLRHQLDKVYITQFMKS